MKARSKLTLALTGALAALALASIGWAAIPDAGGVIHGCYNKGDGHLRVYDDSASSPKLCTSKEAPLDWNQQGPKGEPGFAKAYWNPSNLMSMVSDTAWPGSLVSSMGVPAGSYVFTANLVGKPFGANSPQHNIACRIVTHDTETGKEYWTYSRGTVSASGGQEVVAPMTLSTGWKFGSQGGTVGVYCIAPVDSQAESIVLWAFPVGSLN